MKTISRTHLFENRITLVNQYGRPQSAKLYVIHHEEGKNGITVRGTPELDAAFEARNWEAFEEAEAEFFGGKATKWEIVGLL